MEIYVHYKEKKTITCQCLQIGALRSEALFFFFILKLKILEEKLMELKINKLIVLKENLSLSNSQTLVLFLFLPLLPTTHFLIV